MTTKIKWRLANRPTPLELTELLRAGILTKDEAREILISHETEEDRDKKSLQDEIKFLRELVTKLSANSRTEIIRQIEYVEKPYQKQPWFEPYKYYCSTSNTGLVTGGLSTDGTITASYSMTTVNTNDAADFKEIKTF